MARNCTFNGTDLSGLTGVTILDIKANSIPNRKLMQAELAEADGGILTNAFYGIKTILVTGIIEGDTANVAEGYRDTLLSYLSEPNATLIFEQAGTNRVYTATMQDAVFSDDNVGGHIPFDIRFSCTDPFGYEQNQIQTTEAGVTTNGDTTAITNGGTYKCNTIIWIKLNNFTGADDRAITVTIGGIGVTVIREWAAGEVLVIDGVNKTVTVGGVAVTFTGQFPMLAVGSNTLTVTDSFTARNIDKTIKYTERYL